jgi:Protein of unknown function (DUF2442)
MKRHRIVKAAMTTHPIVRLTFDDGLVGDYDLSAFLAKGPMFDPLKDVAFFRQVAIGEGGRWFGWNLDRDGEEIDFSADGARSAIERQHVEALAELHRARIHAAE